jgi:hypothetical protein
LELNTFSSAALVATLFRTRNDLNVNVETVKKNTRTKEIKADPEEAQRMLVRLSFLLITRYLIRFIQDEDPEYQALEKEATAMWARFRAFFKDVRPFPSSFSESTQSVTTIFKKCQLKDEARRDEAVKVRNSNVSTSSN